jgi:formate dehydrogenase subunit gamma
MKLTRGSTDGSIHRFGRVERTVHWTVALLTIICVLTGAVLYNGSLSLQVGHRHVVEMVHVYCGLALPVPLLLGLFSRPFRTDLSRLNRLTSSDRRWLRSRHRRDGAIKVGKFNAGQKLYAAVAGGALLVLLGTGILMYFVGLVRLTYRTGATLVHDWFAVGLGLAIAGHVYFALRDSQALRGMVTGRVSTSWARDEHAVWAAAMGAESNSEAATSVTAERGTTGDHLTSE